MNRACFPKEKYQNSQKRAKFMNFSFWPFFWFGLPGRLLITGHLLHKKCPAGIHLCICGALCTGESTFQKHALVYINKAFLIDLFNNFGPPNTRRFQNSLNILFCVSLAGAFGSASTGPTSSRRIPMQWAFHF